MKTKIKHHSRSVLAVVLTLCMLVSCMTVGIIATDAAKTADERVGAKADDEALGYTKCNVYTSSTKNGTYTKTTDFSGNSGSFTLTMTANETIYFYLRGDDGNDYIGGDFTLPYNTTFNMGKYYSEAAIKKITFTATNGAGTYTFTVTDVTDSAPRITATGGSGGGGGGDDPDPEEPDPADDTTTTTVNQKSGNTLIVSYDKQNNRNYTHVWYDGESAYIDGTQSAGAMTSASTATGVTGLYYKDITSATTSTTKQIDFLCKKGTGWDTNKSGDVKQSNFKKGKQWYLYNSASSGDYSDTNGEYDPLELVSVENPSVIKKDQAASFTVNVEGGVPKFMSTRGDTNVTYKLSVGTSSGGTQVLNASTCKYAAKKFTFNWTPTTAGSQTLYFTLTDGIDTVTFYKAYTVIVVHPVTFSAGTGGSVDPSGSKEVAETVATTITATPSIGYSFSSWSFGDGITYSSTSANPTDITTKSSGTYTVTANFSKNSYTLTKGAESNGTFTVTAGGNTITTTGSVLFDDTITVTCNPNTGYKVTTVTAGSNTGTEGEDNNSWTVKMPAADATLNVTFAKKDNSITASANPVGGGTVWVASSASSSDPKANFQVGETVYLRANPNAAYNFTKFVVTYANGDTEDVTTNNSSITIPAAKFNTTTNDGSISVVGYFTKKPTYDIIVGTNDRKLGTAVASVSEAYQGQAVTVEVVENTGTYSSYTVKDSSNTDVEATKSGNIISFTMPAKAVTVSVTFTAYSTNSAFYYNSYGSNGQPAATHFGARMTEAKVNGETYSYYRVTGRSEADQLFTVSYGNPDYNSPYVYFQVPNSWTTYGTWGVGESQGAYFSTSDHVMLQDWTEMTKVGDDGNGNTKWKITVPDGARYVFFKGWSSNEQTMEIDLRNGDQFKVQSGKNDDGQHYYESYGTSVIPDMYEYYYSTDHYTNNFSTRGFTQHNENRGGNHAYIKPDSLGDNKTDYYILVLYKNKTYTINGQTIKVTKDPEVIWMPNLPSATSDTDISVYAKDGAIRNNDGYGPYTTLAKIADTVLSNTVKRDGANAAIDVTDHSYQTANPGADSSANDQDYQTATVDPGDIITVTTTINASNKDKYYVKGFIVNGETKAVCQWNSSGVYTFSYTVTGEERNHKVEITPVYFLKDDTNTINFAIDGFEPDLQFNSADGKAKWGDTIYVYPFYSYNGSFITGRKNAFGSYPGQPMVFDGGKYYIQIPKSISYTPDGSATAVTATVSGVTMSNGYWDHVHRSVMGWLDEHNELHRQTYDYDDFYKIANELSPDNITYEFKYRTTTQNKNITTSNTYSSFSTSTFGNGFDDLKDIYGRPIDIFGNLLSTTEQGYSPVYVVSKGYKVTNAGSYATEWEIFYPNQEAAGATTWTKAVSGTVSSINPSALTLKNASRFATYGDSDFTKYKDLYTALDTNAKVKKQPVKITFESEILNDDGDKAERSDGQWFHSKNNDVIHANIQIEYSDDNGATWTADTYATPADASDVTGVTTGGRAYFTNTEKNKDGNSYYEKRETGDVYSNNKEYFTFAAESSANYKFVGWYRKVTTVKNGVTTTNYYAITGDAQSQKTTNDTYVARFVPYTGGNLTVNNILYTGGSYKGNGTTQVKLDVINSNSASAAAIYTTGFKNRTATIGQEYIVENSSKYVRITLKTIPSGIDSFQQFSYLDGDTRKTSAVDTYFPNGGATAGTSYTLDGTAAVKTIIIPIEDLFGEDGEGNIVQTKNLLEYYSELAKWTLKYELKYKFNGREFGTGPNSQWYVVKGDFESNEFNTYVTEDAGHYYIARDFLSNKKPYERDFMKSITWNFDAASTTQETEVVSDAVNHTITYKWQILQNDDQADTERKAIFTLPYCYNPNTDYTPTEYVPVVKYQQRTGTTSGTRYYVFEKYFYTPGTDEADSDWNDYLTEVQSWQTSGSAKYDAAYATTNCPYGYTDGVPNAPAFNTTALHDGIPIYDKANVPTFDRYTTYGKRFVLNDEYPAEGASEEDYEYVTAAPSVWKDNDVKYFSHWQITNNDGKKIAKCYALRFNFSAYDNYQIEAIYEGKSPGSNYYDGEHEPLGATISYLDDSRNQYNEGGHGSNTEANAQNSGDVLFKDFAVAYSYDSKVFNTYTDKKVRVGVAIEWVKNGEDGALINDIDGTDMQNYEDKYSSTESDAITSIRNKLLGSSTPNNIYIKPIASNIKNDTGYKPISDTTLIDNKNRLKYHYAIYNEADGTSYSTKYGVRLYRAYAYIMVDEDGNETFSADEIAVSAKPAYFTFNDVANRKSD